MTHKEFTAWLEGFLDGKSYLSKADKEKIAVKADSIQPVVKTVEVEKRDWMRELEDANKRQPYIQPNPWYEVYPSTIPAPYTMRPVITCGVQ